MTSSSKRKRRSPEQVFKALAEGESMLTGSTTFWRGVVTADTRIINVVPAFTREGFAGSIRWNVCPFDF